MHLLKSLTILSFSTATFLAGCTKTDTPSSSDKPFHQSYNVVYRLTDSITYMTANFREYTASGDTVSITNDSIIKVNNLTYNYNDIGTRSKGWRFEGMPDLSIELLKAGLPIRNTVSTTDVGDFDFDSVIPGTLSRGGSLTVSWAGDPLRDREVVSISLKPIGLSTSIFSGITTVMSGNTITFYSRDLSLFKTEKLRIILSRKIVLPLSQIDGTASGEKIVEKQRYKEAFLTD
jgi:hypothetical protein